MNLFGWTEKFDCISSCISVDNDGTFKEALISKSRLVKSIPQQQMFVIFVVINLIFPLLRVMWDVLLCGLFLLVNE